MQKPLAFTLAVCLGLTGCQIFEKSETWETVMRVRPGDTIHEPDDSAAYAEKLHRVLLEQGVEHIIVIYQFHYYTSHYEEALCTRTAVVYRDDVNPHYPWWLKDDRISTPFWLPNGDLNHQLSFYCQRPAEVIEQHAYPAGGKSGKSTIDGARPIHPAVYPAHGKGGKTPTLGSSDFPQIHGKPQPVTRVTQVKAAPISPAKSTVSTRPAPAKAVADPTGPAVVTKIQQPAPALVARPQTPAPFPSTSVNANPSTSSWTPPTAIDPVAQGSEAREEHLQKLFHAHNGTKYDPTSAVDRRKMEQLKRSSLERDPAGTKGFHHGADGRDANL